jgi:hypothetical protein
MTRIASVAAKLLLLLRRRRYCADQGFGHVLKGPHTMRDVWWNA